VRCEGGQCVVTGLDLFHRTSSPRCSLRQFISKRLVGRGRTGYLTSKSGPRQCVFRIHLPADVNLRHVIQGTTGEHRATCQSGDAPSNGRAAPWAKIIFDRLAAVANARERHGIPGEFLYRFVIDDDRDAVSAARSLFCRSYSGKPRRTAVVSMQSARCCTNIPPRAVARQRAYCLCNSATVVGSSASCRP